MPRACAASTAETVATPVVVSRACVVHPMSTRPYKHPSRTATHPRELHTLLSAPLFAHP
ncbi:uncharacterized protein B0H18DRAFT_1031593, partial [Fomitopsis serialis]|uniref:uncharacterized protein n=1 Tax=Fomitopsis serialis TaxID=139415 RepID=UPI002008C1DD